MKRFKLLKIRDNDVFYADEEQMPQSANLYSMADQEILRYFSIEDQEIINNAAADDGFYVAISKTGERMLVPYKRQNYIFFFIAVFTLSIIMSIFTCIRYIQVGNVTLYGAFLFFPLAFASTDIINELYGYNRVRSVISTTSLALMIMGGLMAITINLNGTLPNGESDADLLKYFQDIPKFIVLDAFILLVTDSLNAYLFHKMRGYLQGKALWLRSIISTFIAHFFHSIILMICVIQMGIIDLPLSKVIDVLYSGHLVKMLYAICSLPFIYGAVYFVKQKEVEEASKGGTI